jgi:hypothetical protein
MSLPRQRIRKTCAYCNKPFTGYRNRAGPSYCSDRCCGNAWYARNKKKGRP